jgi:hypothetical protein
MHQLIEDYLREVEQSLRVENGRKRQIIDELRGHLNEKVDDLARAAPDRPVEDVARQVLGDFGNPRDLALSYSDGAPVLRNQAGEIVLRLGAALGRGTRAVGRGTGKVLKWFAIAVSVLLVIAIGVGIWAFYEVRPVVATLVDQAQPAYEYHESCEGTPCSGGVPGERFFVSPDARQVRFALEVWSPWDDDVNASGSVHVVVKDPSGNATFDRVITMGNGTRVSEEARWAPAAGNWTVSIEYDAFRGSVDLSTYAASVRWSDL